MVQQRTTSTSSPSTAQSILSRSTNDIFTSPVIDLSQLAQNQPTAPDGQAAQQDTYLWDTRHQQEAPIPEISTIRICCLYHRMRDKRKKNWDGDGKDKMEDKEEEKSLKATTPTTTSAGADPRTEEAVVGSSDTPCEPAAESTNDASTDPSIPTAFSFDNNSLTSTSPPNSDTEKELDKDALCFRAVKISSIGGRIMLLRGKKYLFVTPYTSPFLRMSKQSFLHEKQQRKRSKMTKLLERFRSRQKAVPVAKASMPASNVGASLQNTPLQHTPKDTNIDSLYPLELFEHKMLKEDQESGHCGVYELRRIPASSLKDRNAQIRTKDSFVVFLPKTEDITESAKKKGKPQCRCDVIKKRTLVHRDLMAALLRRALVAPHQSRVGPVPVQAKTTPFPSRKGKEPMRQPPLANFLDVVRDWEAATEKDPWKQIWSEEEIETLWANPWDAETAAWTPDQDPETRQEKSHRFDRIQFLRLQLVQIWNLLDTEPSTTAELTLETVLKQLCDRRPFELPENPAEIARISQQAEKRFQKRITVLQAFLAKSRGRQRLLQAIVDMVKMMKRMRAIGGNEGDEKQEEEEDDHHHSEGEKMADHLPYTSRARTGGQEEQQEPRASTSSNSMARLQNPHQLQMVESELEMDQEQCKLVEEILSGMKTALEILKRANQFVSEMDLVTLAIPAEEPLKVDELDFDEEQYVMKSGNL